MSTVGLSRSDFIYLVVSTIISILVVLLVLLLCCENNQENSSKHVFTFKMQILWPQIFSHLLQYSYNLH